MFKYYLSKDYRRTYNQLESLGVLSSCLSLQYNSYVHHFAKQTTCDLSITRLTQVLSERKASPPATIKTLLLLHAWLQTTRLIQNPTDVLALVNILLKESQSLLLVRKPKIFEKTKLANLAILVAQGTSSEQIENEKQIFLLEQIAIPYIHYLQKVISIFEFYHSLKHNFIRLMQPPETWTLINLFKMTTNIASKLPLMCRFIRKSYRPLAQALGEALHYDFTYFYPKLYKSFYSQVAKLQFNYEKSEGTDKLEGYETIVCMLEQIRQINTDLKDFYGSIAIKDKDGMSEPKLINPNSKEFSFLEKEKHTVQVSESTPKFHVISRHTYQSEEQESGGEPILKIFHDLSNEQVWTFRKDNTTMYCEPMLQAFPQCKSVNE